MCNRSIIRIIGLLTLATAGSIARAQQQWLFECIDPENTEPYSSPYIIDGIANDFISINVGVTGTVTYGGENGPCYSPARVLENSGRFALAVGPRGSIQSPFDDNLAVTVGYPRDPAGDYCYARIIRYTDPTAGDDTKSFLFGDGGMDGFYVGASRRYFIAIDSDGDARAELEGRVIGEAVRMRWRLVNTGTVPERLGLKFGAYVGMRTANAGLTDSTGANQANSSLGTRTGQRKPQVAQADGSFFIGYTTTPETRPLRTQRNFLAVNPGFPAFANFGFGQANPYGLRVDNQAFPETPDASPVSQFIFADHGTIMADNNMGSRVFNDPNGGDPILNPAAGPIRPDSDTFVSEACFVQTFTPTLVPVGRSTDVIHYLRSTWATTDYGTVGGPYAAFIDGPKLIEPRAGGLNGLGPNPMTIGAHIDNNLATVDKEIALQNVKVSIELPEGSGLTLAAGEPISRTIARVDPRETASVSWQVVADGTVVGRAPYKIKFESVPGPTKTLEGSVLIAAAPRVNLTEGANLITLPWSFTDTSIEKILDLVQGQDFLAYRWNPDLGEYVTVNSIQPGESTWIVTDADLGFVDLIGATANAADAASGGRLTTLRPGWNMIGNPYPYPVQISHLVGFAEDNPADALSWTELTDSQLVSPSLAFWSTDGTYSFTEGAGDLLLPNRGYWIYVSSFQPIRISWPAAFIEGLSASTRNRTGFQSNDKQWRLNLTARTDDGLDAANYVGVTTTGKLADSLRIYEPPRNPKGSIQMSIAGVEDGKATRLAQSFVSNSRRNEWTVQVKAEKAGDVTVAWPNIGQVPRNVRFQIVDGTANVSKDLRNNASYTFRMDKPGTRELKVQMEPSSAAKPTIGNVTLTRPTRDVRAPFTISYSLSTAATTSIRILGTGGKEVYTVSRGRADNAGENNATWTMRDNANRAVAPGVYQVEILAETQAGDRVRKIVPVNVVR